MSRTTMLVIVIATISVLILAGVSKVLDARKIDGLLSSGDSLRLENAATNVELDRFKANAMEFAAWVDSVEYLTDSLRSDLEEADTAAPAIIQERDAARAKLPDDLTPAARNMIKLERGVAESWRTRYNLTYRLLGIADSTNARVTKQNRAAQILIRTLRAERDSAMSLVARHEARREFNLWRWFGEEVPQMMACAGGGALAATIYDGNALVGAGIGLAACLVKSAVFK